MFASLVTRSRRVIWPRTVSMVLCIAAQTERIAQSVE
jgi:hypothetical protein